MDCKPKIIVIDGQEYTAKGHDLSGDVKIVVLQRGWVFVGYYKTTNENEHRLEKAKCIRVWGTKKGLGEIVLGPTGSTILDESGTVRFHPLTAVVTMDASEAGWKKHL